MSKKMKKSMKNIVILAGIIPTLITPSFISPEKSYAADDQIPELTAYQNGNAVKLEWSVEMLESDVLSASSFEDGQFIPSFAWGGVGNGGQLITNEESQEGNNAFKVVNTLQNGNHYSWPSTSGSRSIMTWGKQYFPNGIPLTISFYAKTDSKGTIIPYGDGGWANSISSYTGYTIAEPATKGSTQLVLSAIPSTLKVSSYLTLDTDPNVIGTMYQVRSIDVATKTITLNTAIGRAVEAGEPLKTRSWRGAWSFNTRTVYAEDGWKRFSINTVVYNNADYNISVRGGTMLMDTETGGTLYIDNVKFGYASEAAVFKNGAQIYRGMLSDYNDTAATDKAKPNTVTNVTSSMAGNKAVLAWKAPTDNGTSYSYTIKGIGKNGESPMSSEKTVDVNTGIKGYSVVVDQNPNTVPDATIETVTNSYQSPAVVTGNYYAHIVAVDNAGNVSDPVHISYTDTVKPSIDLVNQIPSVTNQDVTLQVQASDDQTGVKRIQKPDGSWVNGSTASYTVGQNGSYKFVAEDNAGNQNPLDIAVDQIDKVKPVAAFLTPSTVEMTNRNVEVSIEYPSDTTKKEYRVSSTNLLPPLNHAEWKKHLNATVTGDYAMTLNGTATSQATYINVPVTSAKTYTASIGKTTNIVRIWEYKGSTYNGVAHTLDESNLIKTFTPKADTTILRYELINNKIGSFIYENMQLQEGSRFTGFEAFAQTEWRSYGQPVSMQANGVVEARSLDEAGNVSDLSRLFVNNIDKVSPTAPLIVFDKNSYLITSGADGQSSDVQSFVQINGGEWVPYTKGNRLPDGNYTIRVKTVDGVGNESDITTIERVLYEDALLLANEAVTKANGDLSQLSVDEAKSLVKNLPDSAPEKQTLLTQLTKTQGQVDLNAISAEIKTLSDRLVQGGITLAELDGIQDRLQELYNDLNELPVEIDKLEASNKLQDITNQAEVVETVLKINSSTDLEEIDLDDLISQLPDGDLKEELMEKVNETAKTQDAIKQVEALEGEITSESLAKAKESVAKLTASPEKDQLLERILEAETILNANALTTAVETTLRVDDFAKALEMVSRIQDPVVRQTLEEKLEAIKPVIETIPLVQKAETSRSQTDVNEARLKVNTLPESPLKEELYARLYRYDKQLQTAESKVRSAETYTSVTTIQSATQAIAVLVESPQKENLNSKMTALSKKIESEAIQEAVMKAEAKVTQAETLKVNPYVSDALSLVNALPDGEKKNELRARLEIVLSLMDEATRNSVELLAKINSITDPGVKKILLDVYQYVDFAERYKTRSYIVLALDKTAAISTEIRTSYTDIVEELTSRANTLKNEYNLVIENQINSQDVSKATSYVEMYEKYRSTYYKNKALDAVTALPESQIKTTLQSRIDAVQK